MDEAPLLLTAEDAARRIGCGRTMIYSLIASGDIETVKIGRLRRVPAAAVAEYVERLRSGARKAA